MTMLDCHEDITPLVHRYLAQDDLNNANDEFSHRDLALQRCVTTKDSARSRPTIVRTERTLLPKNF